MVPVFAEIFFQKTVAGTPQNSVGTPPGIERNKVIFVVIKSHFLGIAQNKAKNMSHTAVQLTLLFGEHGLERGEVPVVLRAAA